MPTLTPEKLRAKEEQAIIYENIFKRNSTYQFRILGLSFDDLTFTKKYYNTAKLKKTIKFKLRIQFEDGKTCVFSISDVFCIILLQFTR